MPRSSLLRTAKRRLGSIGRGLAVGICAAGLACAPSLDPAAKADIDRRVEGLRAGPDHVDAPASAQPRPLVPGQWATYKASDDRGEPGFFTYKVVGREANASWVESVSETYAGKTVTQMLVALGDGQSAESVDVREVKVKDARGHVSTFEGPTLLAVRGLYASGAAGLAVSWQGRSQEDVSVLGGTFVGCFRTQSTLALGPLRRESVSWSHPAVPISGLVKSHAVAGPASLEPIAYGDAGAVSEL